MNEETERAAESILHKHADAHIVLAQELGQLASGQFAEAVGARQERDRIERRLNAHAEHAAEKVYQSRVRVAEREIIELRTRLQIAEAKLNTVEADLEHRIVVLESRMDTVMARLDGHDLGFAKLSLDEEGKAALARMMRLGEKGGTIDPPEGGTSRS